MHTFTVTDYKELICAPLSLHEERNLIVELSIFESQHIKHVDFATRCQSVDPTLTVFSDDNFVQLVIRRILILHNLHTSCSSRDSKLLREKKRKGVDRLVDESEGSLIQICTKKAQSRLHEQEA